MILLATLILVLQVILSLPGSALLTLVLHPEVPILPAPLTPRPTDNPLCPANPFPADHPLRAIKFSAHTMCAKGSRRIPPRLAIGPSPLFIYTALQVSPLAMMRFKL